MDLVQASLVAERCQRNWYHSRPVSKDDVDTLVQVATNMPTKQNIGYYSLLVSTNQKLNDVVHDSAIFEEDEANNKWRNAQVSAPLLFLYYHKWSRNDADAINPDDCEEDYYVNTNLGIGISSGATALAASYLGYKTGFCSCISQTILEENVHKAFTDESLRKIFLNVSNSKDIVGLGIGYPHPEHHRQDVVRCDGVEGKVWDRIISFDKEIHVDRVL